MKRLFLSASIPLGLTSCQIVDLTSGYSHLSDTQKKRVITLEKNIDDIHDSSKVYKVSLNQVKQYIETHDKVLLYNYTPFCHSTCCVSPVALISQCRDKGIDVLAISNIYDDISEQKYITFPMLMIDTGQFPTKRRAKYVEQFYFPLTGHTDEELSYVSFRYFKKGRYIKSYRNSGDI